MKHKILIVDDDPDLRILLRQMLEYRDFAVLEAEDGVEALARVEEAKPDAVVLDVMMPRMDGITVCKKLRSRPETAVLPILILSGKVHDTAVAEGLAAGASKYLKKPIPLAELVEHIRSLLPDASPA